MRILHQICQKYHFSKIIFFQKKKQIFFRKTTVFIRIYKSLSCRPCLNLNFRKSFSEKKIGFILLKSVFKKFLKLECGRHAGDSVNTLVIVVKSSSRTGRFLRVLPVARLLCFSLENFM